jgi:hypothetical protein
MKSKKSRKTKFSEIFRPENPGPGNTGSPYYIAYPYVRPSSPVAPEGVGDSKIEKKKP